VDFSALAVLGILWWLFSMIPRGRGEGRGGAKGTGARKLPPARAPESGDATQREGSMLEQILRELERNLEQGEAAVRRPAPVLAPPPPPPVEEEEEEEFVEERESLEEPEQVISLESEVVRTPRLRYDHDQAASEVARRRIASAQARSGALTRADHRKFDERIRQEPADHTAVRRYTPQQLRDAIVWREILGPPVSERE
jgi:hypothetical protein